jgi:hypothetical protein
MNCGDDFAKMKAFIILILLIPLTAQCQFRNNFLGTYTGRVEIHDQGGHFMGTDELFVDPSTTDSNKIVITDTIPWLNFEYALYHDSTFIFLWDPNFRYGYFYSNGDSIYIHDVHNSPYYREWYCGRVGAGINEPSRSLFNISPNPAKEKIFISSNQSLEKAKLRIFDSIGKIVLEKYFSSIQSKTEINLPVLPDGIYLLKIESEKNIFSQKVIIQQ